MIYLFDETKNTPLCEIMGRNQSDKEKTNISFAQKVDFGLIIGLIILLVDIGSGISSISSSVLRREYIGTLVNLLLNSIIF